MEDLIGRTFGGYQLKELVGTGGVASIYKGYDDRLARCLAVWPFVRFLGDVAGNG